MINSFLDAMEYLAWFLVIAGIAVIFLSLAIMFVNERRSK